MIRPINGWLLVEPLTPQEVARVEQVTSSLLIIPDEAPRKKGTAPVMHRWCRVFALPNDADGSFAVGDTVYCDVMRGSQGPDGEYIAIDGRKVLQMPIRDVMAVL